MKRKDFQLKKVFAATTFAPFIEKIVSKKDKDEELRENYRLGLSNLNGLYEFNEAKNVDDTEEGNIKIDFMVEDPNYFKFGPDRLEVQQLVEKNITLEKFVQRFYKLNKLHKDTFANDPLKYGLVQIYQINTDVDLEKLFHISIYDKSQIDNCKNFVLIKNDGFNINIEYTYSKEILNLRVDINDIIDRKKIREDGHFEEIIKYHNKIINQEISRINGGSNG